jgi:hypothetical protein
LIGDARLADVRGDIGDNSGADKKL